METYEMKRRKQAYILGTRPLIDKNAMFSDGTAEYRRPPEPEKNSMVTLRFRARHGNLDGVCLVHDGIWTPMQLVQSDKWFDFYEITVQLGEDSYRYCF